MQTTKQVKQLQDIEVVSIFTVTDFKTGKQVEEAIIGDMHDTQKAIKALRTLYPRHTKFVLDGFELNGTFVPLWFKNRYHD